ncbi:MAG: glycosyl hydrolase family 65 protein [Propionicimonas sp.]|nr:glycosyl hydrolase family 65 protein [Propionicimonas sp.]
MTADLTQTGAGFADPLDRDRFPVDEWGLREVLAPVPGGALREDGVSATLFGLANGYLGVRGDGDGTRGPGHGSFINGFHETYRIRHAEDAYGLARCGQVIQGVPDLAGFAVTCDGAPLARPAATLVEASRCLDFRGGFSEHTALWQLPSGERLQVAQRRMVSLDQAHLAVFECTVTALDGAHEVEVAALLADTGPEDAQASAGMDPRRTERAEGGGLEPCGNWSTDQVEVRAYRCRNSRQVVVLGSTQVSISRGPAARVGRVTRTTLEAGESLRVTTLAAYHSSPSDPLGVAGDGLTLAGPEPDPEVLAADCRATLEAALAAGTEALWGVQRTWLERFWDRADVRITTAEGQAELQQAVRWALFQLAQASAQVAGHGISAKGLSGSGYSGHYFWDTEIYVLPFLIYTDPAAARALLEFRHAMLPAARRRARVLDVAGALFPWRTINGEEASAYYPAGTAQYHIDADIAFAVCQYAAITGDTDFLANQGVDLLVETARMWLSLGFWQADGDGCFHLHGVTGPDEYTAVVDDNLYTNVLARFNLRRAGEVLADLAVTDPPARARAVSRLGIGADEPVSWLRAAEGMYIPWDEQRGIHPQDAHFLSRRRWDLSATSEQRPLLLHHHSLVIYRHQVLKQADVVLALLLRSAEFTAAQKRADFDYYDPITTGDSTLSAVSQSVVAAEVGHGDLALEQFRSALFVDLANRHHNTTDGVHLAAAGGVWGVLVCGFGGLRDSGASPSLDPRLPTGWDALEFSLTIGGSRIAVHVDHDGLTLTLAAGPPAELRVYDQLVAVSPGVPVRITTPG